MPIVVTIDHKDYSAHSGENLAALMLRLNLSPFRRHPVDKSGRAPFCMMGICFECLVEIDGMPSQQACLTAVKDGMIVRRGGHD